MSERLTVIGEMNDAQQAQWLSVLGLSRALLLDPNSLSFRDTVDPSYGDMHMTRKQEHASRGCVDGEVSIVVKPPPGASLKKFFTADQNSAMPPQDYERFQGHLDSDYRSISVNLRHKPIRHGGEDQKTGHEILILDNTVNYYDARIVKLVDIDAPHIPPNRGEHEPDEEFLAGKEFRKVEQFIYSENANDKLEHFVVPYEYAGELSVDVILSRLQQYLGHITQARPVNLEERRSSNPALASSALSA